MNAIHGKAKNTVNKIYVMEAKNGRLLFVDLLKLLAIYLVLWGHCVQQFLTSSPLENDVYVYIYSFHMPLFMVLSGYFSSSSISLPFDVFVKKKAQQLLLPVLSWSVLAFFLYFIMDYSILHKGINQILEDSLVRTLGNFWFLKSLFVCYLIAWCGKKSKLPSWVWIIATLLFSQLIAKYNVKIMYPCFLAGMALRNYSDYIKRNRISIFVISSLIFLLMLFYWDGSFLKPANLMQALSENNFYSIANELFVRAYRMLIGISASISIYLLFMFLFEKINNQFLRKMAIMGQYTLNVYLLQVLLLEILLREFLCLDSMNILLVNYFVTPLISLLVLLVCIKIANLIYKSDRAGFLLFGRNR